MGGPAQGAEGKALLLNRKHSRRIRFGGGDIRLCTGGVKFDAIAGCTWRYQASNLKYRFRTNETARLKGFEFSPRKSRTYWKNLCRVVSS